jgi:hypothetical protein
MRNDKGKNPPLWETLRESVAEADDALEGVRFALADLNDSKDAARQLADVLSSRGAFGVLDAVADTAADELEKAADGVVLTLAQVDALADALGWPVWQVRERPGLAFDALLTLALMGAK